MRKIFKELILSLCEENKQLFFDGECEVRKGRNGAIAEIWKTGPENLMFFIVYRPHSISDAFAVQIGWSTTRSLPKVKNFDLDYFDFDGKAMLLDEYIISLPLIGRGNDLLWCMFDDDEIASDLLIFTREITKAEANERLSEKFRDSLQLFRDHGAPYLKGKIK